jgi:hypothetical protein
MKKWRYNSESLKPKLCTHCAVEFTPSSGSEKFCSEICTLFSRVKITADGCFEATSSFDKDGYAVVSKKGERTSVRGHRLVYEAVWGDIPEGMDVCHHCDNPPCVNPAHLFLGTNIDNKFDSVSKGRHAFGCRVNTNILSIEQVLAIKADQRRTHEIAAEYGVNWSTIGDIRSGKNWSWL